MFSIYISLFDFAPDFNVHTHTGTFYWSDSWFPLIGVIVCNSFCWPAAKIIIDFFLVRKKHLSKNTSKEYLYYSNFFPFPAYWHTCAHIFSLFFHAHAHVHLRIIPHIDSCFVSFIALFFLFSLLRFWKTASICQQK